MNQSRTNKKQIPLTQASRLINAGGVIMVSSCYKDKRNIISLAWHMPLSKNPPLFGIGIAKTHFSYELIRKGEAFIINIPSADLVKAVVAAGSIHGDKVDKFVHAKLTAEKAEQLTKTPRIAECIGHIECRLRDVKDTGDHGLFIGEAVYACAQEGLFDEVWQVRAARPLVHLGGKYFSTLQSVLE